MQVIKRDGHRVNVRFDEITDRISSMCNELNPKIDPAKISQEVGSMIRDGITTSELDQLTSKLCANKITIHPDYGILASRLIIDDHQKNCERNFSDVCRSLYYNKDQIGDPCPMINQEIFDISKNYNKELCEIIDHNRDYLIDYFGFKTLERSYLLKIGNKSVETPQHMWLRVSIGIHGHNIEKVKETYDLMSKKYFTHATPTLFNSGTNNPQFSSCFLMGTEDSVEGIFKTIADCAQVSKWSGGIGIHISNIRAKGSYIRKTAGYSDGIVPMLKTYNATARYINQGGKRNGSFSLYLEPWHKDVLDFLECKKNHGAEELRARDLFYALWIPDLFMKRVKAGEMWSLMCPSECPGLCDVFGDEFEELYTKYENDDNYKKTTIEARIVWEHIINSQIETGTPYMCYKDAVNKKSNQSNIGTIRSSNLCVSPETKILTKNGYFEIKELDNKNVDIWNGEEWSNTLVRKTGENQELIKVKMNNGSEIECTKYHKFYILGKRYRIDNSYKSTIDNIVEVDAQNLKIGMELIPVMNYPVIDSEKEFKYPYTHGFFCGDGSYHGRKTTLPQLALFGEKKKLEKYIDYRIKSSYDEKRDSQNYHLHRDLSEKFTVPINYSLESRLRWLEGILDSDGCISKVKSDNIYGFKITSIHKDFLIDIILMLQTMGVFSVLNKGRNECKRLLPDGNGGLNYYSCKECFILNIGCNETYKLHKLGLRPKRLDISNIKEPSRKQSYVVKITGIIDNNRISDTYCFTEKKRGMGMFNGILTGQCAEINEYSDSKEYAVCNLASICLPQFIEFSDNGPTFNFKKLIDVSRVITYNLNKIIDRNFYPTPETKLSNLKHRPVGVGVQGLADAYNIMKIPFDSDEAFELNKMIFETIYYGCVTESISIAKVDGAYETFDGSPFSKGILQFDMWETKNLSETLGYDWDKVRTDLKQYGIRNSLLTALMPTASTSQILGANECFEPRTSNIYVRRTLAGEFQIINTYLINDLIKLGLWDNWMRNEIIINQGSIKNIESIPDNIKQLYKTVWEIKQKVLIDQSVDRGRFVDQSQSLNLFFDVPKYGLLTKAHFYGWEKGLKTGSYYIRSNPSVNAKSTIRNVKEILPEVVGDENECINCSA